MRARVGSFCKASVALQLERRQRGSWLAVWAWGPKPGCGQPQHRTEQTLPATALVGTSLGVGEVGLNGEFDRLVRYGSTKRGGYHFGDVSKERLVAQVDVGGQGQPSALMADERLDRVELDHASHRLHCHVDEASVFVQGREWRWIIPNMNGARIMVAASGPA
jgi:hypothetical protein